MRFVGKRFRGTVIAFIPPHERGFRDVIAAQDKAWITCVSIEFDCMDTGVKFVWQIPLCVCYTSLATDLLCNEFVLNAF